LPGRPPSRESFPILRHFDYIKEKYLMWK